MRVETTIFCTPVRWATTELEATSETVSTLTIMIFAYLSRTGEFVRRFPHYSRSFPGLLSTDLLNKVQYDSKAPRKSNCQHKFFLHEAVSFLPYLIGEFKYQYQYLLVTSCHSPDLQV